MNQCGAHTVEGLAEIVAEVSAEPTIASVTNASEQMLGINDSVVSVPSASVAATPAAATAVGEEDTFFHLAHPHPLQLARGNLGYRCDVCSESRGSDDDGRHRCIQVYF